MFRKSCFFLVLFIVIACFSPRSLGAQQVAVAEVTGLVTDSTGAAVPGATVKMIETSKGVAYTVTTNSGGNYLLPGLPPGPYRLEASKVGFKTYVLSNIELQVNDHHLTSKELTCGLRLEIDCHPFAGEISRACISYLKLSGSRASRRPCAVSACGYIKNPTGPLLAPGRATSCAKL
jgi:Carboxypeptidase regulatory-like domain